MSKSSGVALITVMLILALATTIAVSMVSRQRLDVHRTSNVLNFEQSYQYISMVESFAKLALIEDYRNNAQVATLGDIWARRPPLIVPIEGGKMTGFIEDLQGRFNINSLVIGNQRQQAQADIFQQLLDNLGISANIVNKIVDWLDSDSVIRTNGAENDVYLNYDDPYHVANQTMTDISELRLVDGVTFDIYNALLPFVCALDTSIPANLTINVNTASPEVISALANNITLQQAQQFDADRGIIGFVNVAAFLNDPLFSQIQNTTTIRPILSVSSGNFRLTSFIKINNKNMVYISHLRRVINNNAVTVELVSRSRRVL